MSTTEPKTQREWFEAFEKRRAYGCGAAEAAIYIHQQAAIEGRGVFEVCKEAMDQAYAKADQLWPA